MRKHRNTGRGGARAAVLAFALLLTFASRASLADQATPPRIPVHQTRLPNGLTVVLEEDPRTPIVAISLRYGAGSADEPSSARGASLLVLEMMRESSLHVSAGGFDRLLTAAGGVDLWGVTSFDDTRFSATLPSGRLALGLWILSDQMGFFAQRADAPLLEQERRVALSERRQRIANQALGEVPRFLREAVYGSSHPYASSVYGDRGELDTLTLPEVVDFFDAHFGPERAVLSIVGDVRRASALALVEKYFGPIPRGLATAPKPPPPPQLSREKRLSVEARVSHASVHVAWPIPAPSEPGATDLDVVVNVLHGFVTAKLQEKLIDERKIASTVNAFIVPLRRGSLFEIRAEASGTHTPEELLTSIDEVLAELRARPLPPEAVRGAVVEAVRPRIFGLERVALRASEYSFHALFEGAASGLFDDFARYDRVTPESVERAVQKYLPSGRRVVAFVTPRAEAPLAGIVAGEEER
jgi:predicted Zn-dependent peptidase